MDPDRFYFEMLNYLQSLWCALNPAYNNRGMVITFGATVQVRVPFQQYTATQWFNAIETLRSDTSLCCACCTPTAEAFRLAKTVLTNNQIPGTRSTVVFVVTDGDPWQNKLKTAGTIWTFPKYDPARYRYVIVPTEARALKQAIGDLRVMLVGVPNKLMQPPAKDYFEGIPDPTKYPAGQKTGFKQCIKRNNKLYCATMNKPPFPIVSLPIDKNLFSSDTWNVKDMLNDTSTDLCRIRETTQPTKSPTTSQPTVSPTEKIKFEGLDVMLFLDRSKSMQWHSDVCRQAPGANLQAPKEQVCWQLFVRFTEALIANATQIRYPLKSSPPFGWQATRAKYSQGIRAFIYGFACTDSQSTPIVVKIGEGINNAADFAAAMVEAKKITPNGGTCPSAAFERSLGQIMKDITLRPFKTAVLITDGVFYDVPKPSISTKGFAAFGIMTYALGIAIPDNGNNFGLKPGEIALQKSQLLDFVNEDEKRVLNFGEEGLKGALDNVASGIIAGLPAVVEANFPFVYEKPYYCGFTNNERCLNTDPATFDTAKYCKWIPNDWAHFSGNGRCMDKNWCDWPTKASCQLDKFCDWAGGKCYYPK